MTRILIGGFFSLVWALLPDLVCAADFVLVSRGPPSVAIHLPGEIDADRMRALQASKQEDLDLRTRARWKHLAAELAHRPKLAAPLAAKMESI